MLYHLFYSWLSAKYTWLNVFQYQTFRAICSFLFCFTFVLVSAPWYIRKLKSLGIKGQPIRDDGPKDHETKRGTPTMGGLVIIVGVTLSTLLFCELNNRYVWLCLAVMLSYAYLGFVDDWKKIVKQDSQGLTERQKLFWQIGIAGIAALILMLTSFPTALAIPFMKDAALPLSILFIPFVILVVIGTSNAVNITDGLDGLAIGPVMTVGLTYAVFAYVTGNIKFADYLNITYIPGVGELSIVLSAIIAGGLAFLWYNTFPAQIFMGDTGALSLGGVLGFIAVITKQEIILIVAGGIFVVEAISVLIQRYYYKATKKRFFKMAPIHHHFELLGWPEPKIIVRFWIISFVLALISLSALKLR